MAIIVVRRGAEYTAEVTPPEVAEAWRTGRPYGRDELRWKIESLGAHPVDVADAFFQADKRAGEKPAIDWPNGS